MSDKRTRKVSRSKRPKPAKRRAAQGSQLSRLREMTDKRIRARIAADPDAAPELDETWLARARVKAARPAKEAISFRVDRDVLEYFRSESPKYQSRMHEVLRAYVDHQLRKRPASSSSRG